MRQGIARNGHPARHSPPRASRTGSEPAAHARRMCPPPALHPGRTRLHVSLRTPHRPRCGHVSVQPPRAYAGRMRPARAPASARRGACAPSGRIVQAL